MHIVPFFVCHHQYMCSEYALLGAPVEKQCNSSFNCKVVMCWFHHLSVCDQICALWLIFFMHLVVMIRLDKNC
jgi:hypothetical protein